MKFYGTIQVLANPLKLGLLYELCDSRSLANVITDVKREPAYTVTGFSYAQDLALNIVKSLDYLHGNNVIHRNLKPENILVSNLKGSNSQQCHCIVVM